MLKWTSESEYFLSFESAARGNKKGELATGPELIIKKQVVDWSHS